MTAPTRYVYFVADAQDHIKIGISSNPTSRLDSLQTGAAQKLELVVTIPGTGADERFLHGIFAEFRVAGEWFRGNNILFDFMCFSKMYQKRHGAVLSVEEMYDEWGETALGVEACDPFRYDRYEWEHGVQ